MSTIKKILKFTPHFLKKFFRKTLIFLRKGAGFISSRALYFVAGLFLALAIYGIQAAWNSTVSSGQPLTSTLWNDVVNKLVELDKGDPAYTSPVISVAGGSKYIINHNLGKIPVKVTILVRQSSSYSWAIASYTIESPDEWGPTITGMDETRIEIVFADYIGGYRMSSGSTLNAFSASSVSTGEMQVLVW